MATKKNNTEESPFPGKDYEILDLLSYKSENYSDKETLVLLSSAIDYLMKYGVLLDIPLASEKNNYFQIQISYACEIPYIVKMIDGRIGLMFRKFKKNSKRKFTINENIVFPEMKILEEVLIPVFKLIQVQRMNDVYGSFFRTLYYSDEIYMGLRNSWVDLLKERILLIERKQFEKVADISERIKEQEGLITNYLSPKVNAFAKKLIVKEENINWIKWALDFEIEIE